MKKAFITLLLMCGTTNAIAQKTQSFEAEGNLESSNPLGCVDISEVTNEHSPADILHGMGECLKIKKYEKAAKLFAIAGVYGTYDSYRVEDRSAHQALLVLQRNVILNTDESAQNGLMNNLKTQLESGSENLNTICQSIREIGIPNYYPKYMIQHGIQAFTKNEWDGLKADFDSEASWKLALESYLHCTE